MRTFTPITLVFLLSLSLPASAQSQSSVRVAGNELRFRVIDRFPSADDWPWSSEARRAFERGEWKTALQHISPATDPGHQFAYGYAAYKSEEYERAYTALSRVAANSRALLRDYAALYAAESALASERHDEAQRWAAAVSKSTPVHADAMWVLARSLSAASPESQKAERALRGFIATYGRHAAVSEAKLGLATLHLSRGDHKEAAAVFYDVIVEAPLSTEATAAKAALKTLQTKLPAAERKAVDLGSDEVRMARAEALFGVHRSKEVISELSKTWANLEDSRQCRALYLVARSHTKLRQHSDSLGWYDRLLEKCDAQTWQRRGLYLAGKGSWNAGKHKRALGYFEKIYEDHASHSFADDALYFSARIRREDDRNKDAAALLKRQVREHPSGDMAKDAHWLLVREMFASRDYQAAVSYINGLNQTGEDDLYTRGRLAYFRGRALELSGKKDAARKAYRAVVEKFPLSHYSLFALNRLFPGEGAPCRGAACGLKTERRPLPSAASDLQRDPRYLRAQTLLGIELSSLARRELDSLRRDYGKNEELWKLADRLDEAHAYPISHDLARRHIEGWTDHYPEPGSRMWQIAYPRPFWSVVNRWTHQRKGVDWALAYAIMREESGFSPSIESWANARGLMQLIEPTAQRMAKAENLSDYTFSRLFDPDIALRLGTAYLAFLAEKSNSHPALVIAGYNGGWGNVGSWLEDPPSRELDLWIEDIPYGQTRKYAKRVLQTYWTYRFLYEKSEVPRLPMRVK